MTDTLSRIMDSPGIDFARVMCCLTAFAIIVMLLVSATRPRGYHNLPGDRQWDFGVALFALLTMVQEAQQVGKAFVVWRLPLFFAANLFIAVALYRRLKAVADEDEARTERDADDPPGS